MSSIDQYIELVLNHRGLIDEHSPQLLNEWREKALFALGGKKLPEKGDEGYEHISIEDMFEPDRGVNIARVALPEDTSASLRCQLPNVTTALAYVFNDSFKASRDLDRKLKDGVVFCSLAKAAKTYPEIVERYY